MRVPCGMTPAPVHAKAITFETPFDDHAEMMDVKILVCPSERNASGPLIGYRPEEELVRGPR